MTDSYDLRQSIGTSSDWTYQSTSPTPLTSASFPLTPVSADGDPFCTDSFCQDNSGTDNDADYYTSRYQYVRVRAVWSVNQLGTIETWPLRNNPGQTVYTGDWFQTNATNFRFVLEDSSNIYLSPRRPQGSPYPPWLINYTQRGANDAPLWTGSGQGNNFLLFINAVGNPQPAGGGMSAYNLPMMNPGDFFMSVAGVFQFTNGPLLGYPTYGSESAIVDWPGLPHPSNYIYS
jgi:hypothetical protein